MLQLREWITESAEGATWALQFDELLLELGREEKARAAGESDVSARDAWARLREHVTKARWRRGERLG